MATYLTVNLMFLLGATVALLIARRLHISRAVLVTVLVLVVFTAIFDSIIIALGVCAYNPELILDIRVGLAPVEDFFYAILAGVMVPMIWGRNKEQNDETKN